MKGTRIDEKETRLNSRCGVETNMAFEKQKAKF